MKKEAKAGIVDDLSGSIDRAQVGVVTSYQGLPTPELVKLRHKFKEAGVEFKVVKNTLARRAVNGLGRGYLSEHLDGAIALALGYDDVTAPARVLAGYIKASGINMQVVGGFLPDRWLDAAQVDALASMPSREVLIGQVVGALSSPIYGLVNSLTSPMLGLVWALQARIQQMEAK
ncbi:MAG: 50S ribosomal protein L10 [Dehalococcoidia bacterium]|nr:50S ribosomal protein L10 [Dehalococcoidia bacterium]